MRDSDALDNNPHISRSALAALHDQAFGWALSRCQYDRSVAEDLVQQTYVELLTGKAQFDARASLKTFVFSVLQNLANSRYRRLQTRLRLLQQTRHDLASDAGESPTVNENKTLWLAVQQLSARQRDIVELVFCRDLTIEEASRVMGVTTGTGRAHYDRAKKALRRKLDDRDGRPQVAKT